MKKNLFRLLLLFVPLFFCAAQSEEGMAGRLSSISGSLSAAHVSLTPGTRIRVTNLETGRSIAVVVNRRLRADSGHIVELTVPAAEAIGLREEARVRVDQLNSDGTPVVAETPGSTRTRTGPAESPNNRETAAGQGPELRAETGTERTSREPVTLPPVRTRSRQEAVIEETETEAEDEIEDESDSQGFYYVNSYEGEYPGDPDEAEPPLPRESGPSSDDIVTLPPETGRAVQPQSVTPAQAQPAAPPAQTRPVPPPPVPPPERGSPPQSVTPAQALPAAPPAQTRPVPPPPVPPPERGSPPQSVTPAQSQPAAPPVQTKPVPPPERGSPPQSGQGTASARVALPADTDRVVLSMTRDETGKLWVYVESETAREIAVTEVPRPAPIQTPVPDQARPRPTQAPPPVPPAQIQAPPPRPVPPQVQASPPVPPPVPERRQVTVTIIPRLPPAGDGKRYILQVGSYRDRGMAEYRLFNLQNAGIAAVMEPQGAAIRIIVNGVYAEDIPALAEKLGRAGVTEIWVRER